LDEILLIILGVNVTIKKIILSKILKEKIAAFDSNYSNLSRKKGKNSQKVGHERTKSCDHKID
jgi:hypothetical protein